MPTDFDAWLGETFARTGPFTALVVLVAIANGAVTPLCSTFFNVIGEEVDWAEMTALFAGAGRTWDGAAFFPATAAEGGPLDNERARVNLRDIEHKLSQDRLILNDGHFFDAWGRRLKIEEIVQ